MQRAVVTGGAGFIGSHVAETLLAAEVEVLVLDDLSSGLQANLHQIETNTGKQVNFVGANIASPDALDAIVHFAPDAIFHLAAQANVRKSVKDPLYDAHANILGTVNLLEAARIADTATFVFSSTGGAVYGEQDYFPADEEHRTSAECPYGVSKRCGELYVDYYARTYGIRCVSLRYANVYGPRQNPKGEAGVIAIFIDRLKAGEPLLINGDGEQTRDFVYVGDIVQANLLAAKNAAAASHSIYNVGSEIELSVKQVAETLKSCWKRRFPDQHFGEHGDIEIIHGPVLPGEQRRSVVSTKKIQSELGWKAQMDFETGIAHAVESSL